jgi:signal transduction histidine kinase/ActR/RegA family two-component response regulator/predicted negative regulator of RcsB-dependent stress response
MDTSVVEHFGAPALTMSEQVLACCAIAREKLVAGDYDSGCDALHHWWTLGEWPRQSGLSNSAAAELLLVAGTLSGWVASSKRIPGGRKPAEALLNGSIAIFEQMQERVRAAEGRIELACCYYHQGAFDLARATLHCALTDLTEDERELRSVGLIRLAVVERLAGRLHDALTLLDEATPLLKQSGEWPKGRFHLEFANTLKDLGIAEGRKEFFEKAFEHYRQALSYFKRVGNHRYTAIVENNHGYLLSSLNRFDEACVHLDRARRLFEMLQDNVRRAQVDETLAQLYLASGKYGLAEQAIKLSVETLEISGEEAFLAEALTTRGIVLCRLGKKQEAKPCFERAQRIAERCEDNEAAGRALLILIEEMCEQLADDERREIGAQANQLLANSQQPATRERLRKCLETIAEAHTRYEAQREQEIHAQKMAALGELSFGVAHNVNNTLTGILGRAQLILRNSNDPAKIEVGLELIIKSAEDGAHIIRRIQDFARQRPSREFEVISIAELLKDACEMTRPRWEARSEFAPIRFALNADCKAHIKGDPVELREVLVNMIYNAIDAMPSGGEVRVSTQENRERVVVHITDTGTGMGPEVKQRLFDPFFTTKGKAGTGMGLAVSFGIIRRHEGSIEVDSEPGRGTTFKISLPKVVPELPETKGNDSTDIAVSASEDKVRVLVVDDETHVREVLIEALEADGCEVVSAQSGEIALALYEQYEGKFDAVFTDIGMPDMNGWELVTEIRERSKTMPIAIISGWADAISVQTRNAVKADWVVAKPFDINKISSIAQEIAQRKTLNLVRD